MPTGFVAVRSPDVDAVRVERSRLLAQSSLGLARGQSAGVHDHAGLDGGGGSWNLKVGDDAVLGGVRDVGVEQADVGHEGGLRPRLRSAKDLLCMRVGLQQL